MPLSTTSILRAAVGAVAASWRPLATALVVPTLMFVAIDLDGIANWTVDSWSLALCAVVCHRVVLLGPGSLPNRFGYFVDEAVLNYAFLIAGLRWLVFGLADAGFGLVGTSLDAMLESEAGRWLVAVFAISALYLFARSSLAFPAIAVGDEAGLARSWELTRGEGWRLSILILLSIAAGWGARAGWDLLFGTLDHFVLPLVRFLLLEVLAVLGIAVFSVAYRELASRPPRELEVRYAWDPGDG